MLARGGVQRALAILSRILRETMMSLGSGGDLMAEANSGETAAVEGSARGFLSLALGFWSGPTRRAALLWSVGALVLVFCNLAVNVGLNHWNRWFFDALERKQGDTLLLTVGVFLMLILVAALREIDEVTDPELSKGIVIENTSDTHLHLDGLSVAHRNGKVVISETDVSIAPGERVLLGGASGSGKSTLIRAVVGLWPWGSGRILLPPGRKTAFVPQRPYLPLGTLRDALAYPGSGSNLSREEALAALKDAGLSYMAGRLDARRIAGVRSCPAASANASRSRGCCFSDRISS